MSKFYFKVSFIPKLKHRHTSRTRETSGLTFLIFPVIIFILAGPGIVAIHSEESAAAVQGARQETLPHSVAVMPLTNLSPAGKNAFIAAGIHKEILGQLAKIRGLNVIARTSVMNPAYVDGSMSIPAIAADLDVATIMTGSIMYTGDEVHVTAQLFDGKTGAQLWTNSFNGSLTDLFGFQTEIASHIADVTQVDLMPEIRSLINKPVTHSPEAYTLYLKAQALVPGTGSPLPLEYYQFLEQAIAIDPNFAYAHAAMAFGLGDSLSYSIPVNGYTFPTMERIALSHIEMVMETGSEIDMAYMAQAFIHWTHLRGTPAKQAFERAMQLSPDDVEIMDDYARFLSFTGDHGAAVELARRATMLAPRDPASHYLLGHTLAFAGSPAAAVESVRRAITLNSSASNSHLLLGEIEFLLGNNKSAQAELVLSEQLSNPGTDSIEDMAILIYTYSRLGLKQDTQRLFSYFNARVATGEYVSTSTLALAYLAIGNKNVTFDLLNRNPNEGIEALQHIKFNILKDPALETSRFQELRRRIARLSGGVTNIQTPPF